MTIEMIFEDNADGSVMVKCTPGAETLFEKYKKRLGMSPAECMALAAISAAVTSSERAKQLPDKKALIIC